MNPKEKEIFIKGRFSSIEYSWICGINSLKRNFLARIILFCAEIE